MGRPPGRRSNHPVLPSGVPNETASRSRLGVGRFTFIAVLKSIRCTTGLAGASTAFFAVAAGLAPCCESRDRVAERTNSKLKLTHRVNVQLVEENIGTSTAQRPHHRQLRLEVERPGREILQPNFLLGEISGPEIPARLSPVNRLEVEPEFGCHGTRRNKVGATKRGEEVIQSDLVCNIDGR